MPNFASMLAILLLAFLCQCYAEPSFTDCMQSSWYSEEEGYPSNALIGAPMIGLSCREKYCDQMMSKQCPSIVNGDSKVDITSNVVCSEMLSTISDEQGSGTCPDGQFVDRMKCEGRYCDNIRLSCCNLPNGVIDYSKPFNTDEFSDELANKGQDCPSMYAVIGVYCKGKYCDTMRLICAPIALNAAAGPTSGSWVMACSTNVPDDPCTFTQEESVSRKRQTTWDSAFTSSVETSVNAGVKFLNTQVTVSDSVTRSVESLMSEEANIDRSCSTTVQRNLTVGDSETVWWQWWMYTDDVSITDPAGTSWKLTISTCFFELTHDLDNDPKCSPGYCADSECQTCSD